MDIIVSYRTSDHGRAARAAQGRQFRGARQLDAINGLAMRVTPEGLERLSLDPSVESVSPDLPVYAAAVAAGLDYAYATIDGGAGARAGLTGKGIGVIIASGVFDHNDLKGSNWGNKIIVYEQSFIGGDIKGNYGHGTHVAGLLAGNGQLSIGGGRTQTLRGLAPDVKILNLKVLDANGAGKDSAVIAAIDRAIALKKTYNVRVINLSIGRPVSQSYRVDPLCLAVERAWKSGIVVVAAAGNEGRNNAFGNRGYGTIMAPGNSPYVITVGAMRTNYTTSRLDDGIASFSSKGPTVIDHIAKPDLVAPGNQLISLLADGTSISNSTTVNRVPNALYEPDSSGMSPHYYRLSGTSMAAPLVAGAAALMLQRDPSLTPDQVKARLMKTASKNLPAQTTATDPVTGQSCKLRQDLFAVGAGYLDVGAALANNSRLTGAALSPRVLISQYTGKFSLIFDSSALWVSRHCGASQLSGGSRHYGASPRFGGSRRRGGHRPPAPIPCCGEPRAPGRYRL